MAPDPAVVGVIGGGGHVGLPLALSFADSGLKTLVYDIDAEKLAKIRAGVMPFKEEGGAEILGRVLQNGRLVVDSKPTGLSECKFLVMVIGTPVDEHLNPSFMGVHKAFDLCLEHLRPRQILILRSTVFPGISSHIQRYLDERGLKISVTFCPERVAQGQSIREFRQVPQIISGFDPAAVAEVRELFGRFGTEIIEMAPMEAELCKLMTNSWRYIQFAIVNQFYMIATQAGLDFDRILHGCRFKYPRTAGMPRPGLAAGPCLVKDTMQLAAFSHNQFVLGHAAMLINEGLPAHLIEMAKREVDLTDKTTAILGMAFKAESDDSRDSLSYKLRKLLTIESRRVRCTDPYVQGPDIEPLDRVVDEADVLFIAAPHEVYRTLKVPRGKVLVDPWSCVETSRHR
ncbi:MAG: nucleotide sugar dehydrogenase [Planctomycetes bacterium]|nr:nucleotide sugar dehydrogenase [Planctomycetota bacterium]MBI3847700.1 nucleotide sugar dehydrogenase [Planctomycetota bacterium]